MLIAANAVLVASGHREPGGGAVQAADGGGVPRWARCRPGSSARLNLVKSKFFAQPNLLADRRVVGEYFQEQIDPQALGAELLAWLDDAGRRAKLEQEFVGLHVDLKRDASARAAQAILDLLRRPRPVGGDLRR